ncbi:Uncharacterised protein [Klebsiella pneumoniae subsp. ozaenae]|uniref:Uncharacterized protein n=1 Tax=Klebsiella pneumoniae subsp. ozaenae TaxID=574 RepID=A0A377ZDK7_KLEPO|nr:Uncharacterised protein [Klebsiella pneumoniae subsp. ozaenae]VFS26171.1 Uncharacterised protein [Serratia liquefaciens]
MYNCRSMKFAFSLKLQIVSNIALRKWFRWMAAGYSVGLYIFNHHAAGLDNGPFPNGNPRQNNHIDPKPNIIPDMRILNHISVIVGNRIPMMIVIFCDQYTTKTTVEIITDSNTALSNHRQTIGVKVITKSGFIINDS